MYKSGVCLHHKSYKFCFLLLFMDISSLIEIGLTRNEARIYLALLKHSPALVGHIAEISNIHRRNVYDALERLIEKGIVTYIIKDGKKYFSAADPKRLVSLLKEKEQIIKTVLPELTELFKRRSDKQDAEIFRGKAALLSMLNMHITDKKDLYIFGSNKQIVDVLGKHYAEHVKEKEKAGVRTNIIFNSSSKSKKMAKNKLTEIRYLPQKYDTNISTVIWGDKVALQLWLPDEPLAILIRSQDFARGFKVFFDIMWSLAK